jgi:hypothetical protein
VLRDDVDIWLGITDEVVEETWVWNDGTTASWTNWAFDPLSDTSVNHAYLNTSSDCGWSTIQASSNAIEYVACEYSPGEYSPGNLSSYYP